MRLSEQLGFPTPLEVIRERLSAILWRSDHCILVAEAGSGKVGDLVHGRLLPLLEELAHMFLDALVVDEQLRKRGVDAQLMRE